MSGDRRPRVDQPARGSGRLHRVDTVAMDTWIAVQVVSPAASTEVESAVYRSLEWIGAVERATSRFEPESEVARLARRPGEAVRVSALLLEATDFALRLAHLTGGAFDPTIGALLERRGFTQSYRTGQTINTGASGSDVDSPVSSRAAVSYRDVSLDRRAQTIRLRQPLTLDLGAVAKGLAIDLVARDLVAQGLRDFSVEAGGDVYARGRNAAGLPWQIGIQDPRDASRLLRTVPVSEGAVCTSGDYERRAADGTPHILDARTGKPGRERLASASVLAPTAMAADGLSTAAMLLGPRRGLRLLEQQGVAGLLVEADGTAHVTRGGFGGQP